jgi:hypothetical protein
VVLQVTNAAGISPATLLKAQQHAASIYSAIGVRIVWADAEDARHAAPAGPRLTLVLLSTETLLQSPANEKVAGHIIGQAFRDARRAYLFSNRIAALATKYSRDRATMLGHAMAHETGHLLLPADSHSASGLMSANLDMETRLKGARNFTAEQGALIRARLADVASESGTDSAARTEATTRCC